MVDDIRVRGTGKSSVISSGHEEVMSSAQPIEETVSISGFWEMKIKTGERGKGVKYTPSTSKNVKLGINLRQRQAEAQRGIFGIPRRNAD